MAENISEILTGSQSLSRIMYHTDLQKASGVVIPLGVMAEVVIGNWRALGLVARTTLSDHEQEKVARMLKEALAKPFDFLMKEFDWAVSATKPGTALQRLAARFSESIYIAPPVVVPWKKALPAGDAAERPILAHLRRFRDDEFDLMMAETRDSVVTRGEDERAALRLAA